MNQYPDVHDADSVRSAEPRKSVAEVSFPGRGGTLAYYNDLYDLRIGDTVYVEGKMEGIPGTVESVSYNFRIRLSDYRKVVYLVDTEIHGQLIVAGSHFVSFDRDVLPAEKIRGWFLPPLKDEEDYVIGTDDDFFSLENLDTAEFSLEIIGRGRNYYIENRVKYLSIDGEQGYAIVEGTRPYEVEFTCRNGKIGNLVCSCFCSFHCKHEYATLLQLTDLLKILGKDGSGMFERTQFFAAIDKISLLDRALLGKRSGVITL